MIKDYTRIQYKLSCVVNIYIGHKILDKGGYFQFIIKSPLMADCVEKLTRDGGVIYFPICFDSSCRVARSACRCGLRHGDQFCEFSEVLSGSCEKKFIPGAGGTAQPEAIQLENALEMGEQHLDFLTFPT